ncbi:MAG: peptide chain release factor 1 [bacterium]
MADFEAIKKEYNELLRQLGDPGLISDWEKFEELSKKKKEIEKILEKQKEIAEIENQIQENKAILTAGEDQELTSLAKEDLNNLLGRKAAIENELKNLTENQREKKDEKEAPDKFRAAIIEIRAGTGGQESALFAGDLFRMYSKYARISSWKQKILDSSPSELGGFKEIVFELSNGRVFSKMKYEAGVHRVQRIPATEKNGRVHTSTATVAVLPKPEKTEIKISPNDLRTDVYKASGPGGQYVNKRETAVRITHLPSGLVVTSQTERNLLQNKENAMSILEAKLLERKESQEMEKMSQERKSQIGWAKRAEKIRTYNFPQDRVTDHRIKKSFHDIEGIINGNLDPIFKSLQSL